MNNILNFVNKKKINNKKKMSVTFRTLDDAEKKVEIEIKQDEIIAPVLIAPILPAPVLPAQIEQLAEIKNAYSVDALEHVINTKVEELKRQITEEIKTQIRLALDNYRKSIDTDGDGVISVKEATVEAQRVCKWSCSIV
jgi:regulator of PEP synthase PpsR (kinase-PPPase family)